MIGRLLQKLFGAGVPNLPSSEPSNLPASEPLTRRSNEKCVLSHFVHLYETTEKAEALLRACYGQGDYSKKYLPGLRLHAERFPHGLLHYAERGDLHFTTQRLVYEGFVKNVSVSLDRIRKFTCWDNGLFLEKDSGKNLLFEFEGEMQLIAQVLSQLIDNHNRTSRERKATQDQRKTHPRPVANVSIESVLAREGTEWLLLPSIPSEILAKMPSTVR